jgi:hypothetical protein
VIVSVYSVDKLISEARRIAAEYRRATGKTLGGVSGEIAENDAARLLNLELCKEKPGGYDAVGRGSREGKRIQIKGRSIFGDSKTVHRIGQVKIDQEWDSIMLVLMDEDFEPFEIYEVDREVMLQEMAGSGGSKRSKRGAMSVAKFKNIADLVWLRGQDDVEDEIPGQQSAT